MKFLYRLFMESVQQLLSRKVDRKEFLLYIGIIFLTATGILHMIKNISNIQTLSRNPKKQTKITQTQGFGGGTYGGIRKGSA